MPDWMVGNKEIRDVDCITIDMAVEAMAATAPHIWRRLYTKHIDSPGNFYPYKAVPLSFMVSIVEVYVRQSTAVANVCCFADLMERYDYPTYYVSGPLVKSLMRTHPPADMLWSDVLFPYPAMVFMVPRQTLFEPDGGEITIVGVAKLEKGVTYLAPGTKTHIRPPVHGEDRICIFWGRGPNCLTIQDCVFPASQRLEPDGSWIDAKTKEHEFPEDGPTGAFSSYIAGILANFLLVMQARKELVERGGRTKKVLKSGKPVHTPTFIGRKYEVLHQSRQQVGITGHYTELGWRAGHFRRQHVGPGRTETKLILIDAYVAFTRGFVPTNNE